MKVEPGSRGEAWCYIKDPNTNLRHGAFLFDIDANYVPPEKNIIKVKKV